MKLKKFLSGAVTAALLGTMMCSTVFAAEPSNGTYTGEIHFLNANGSGNNSMCDPIFCHEADVVLTDDSAELTFYVAYPIPAFSDQGTDGTIKDVAFTVDGTEYAAESDIVTKPEKEFYTDAALFGISAGDLLPTQVLSVELPRDVLDDLEAGTVSASAYVNVFMNSTQNFFVKVTDLQAAGGAEEPAEDTRDMQITATVEEKISSPSYTVTILESLDLGTLSAEKDTVFVYPVKVAASDLKGTLSISAPETGVLSSGENTLAFSNDFGTQSITEDTALTSLSGQLTVAGEAVASAAAGNYTGTTSFTVTYTAD